MITPQEFVAKWKNTSLKERSSAQEHFIDVCRLIGHPTPAEMDPNGNFFCFEAGASKQAGGEGWADVWFKHHFAWEYKGKHANLDKAYDQLLQYREALENPPLLIVSDIENFRIHTNFTNTAKKVYDLTLEDLLKPDRLEILRQAFTNPEALRAPVTTEHVTEEAARQFAKIAELLRKYGADPLEAAHFLIQLLFCLFAEDVGLLPEKLFSRLVEKSRARPQAFSAQLRQLFAAMAEGGWFGAEEIRRIDGHLFEDDHIIDLDSDSLDILNGVCGLDWASIEPSVFGTLFERSLDPSKRSQLGAHYTSRVDIELIVEPVLMQPLRRRWAEIQEEAHGLAEKREAAKGSAWTKLDSQISSLLLGFGQDLAKMRVLDPACGSGNFLYVALKKLLDLWKEVSTFGREIGVSMMYPAPGLAPSPAQLYGIEINEYAHELAQTTIWIGYIQWFVENGFGFPPEPILRSLDNIKHMDAILTYDLEGKPVEPEWPEAEVIIGNPPFLGGNKIRQELGNQYVNNLFTLYLSRVPAFADYVCYWFEKARLQIIEKKSNRAGLLATNSIRGGANREILKRITSSGNIFWAQSDRDWILEGAAVNVSMIGFDNGNEKEIKLDNNSVININPDLTTGPDLTKAKILMENTGISFQGPSPKAPFDVNEELAREMLSAPINVNGRQNSEVVRLVFNAEDIVQNPRKMWTIDFGLMDKEQAAAYELPFEYVRRQILPIRKTRRDDYRGQWWQYARPRPEMRAALEGKYRYIATPRVAKHRIFVWFSSSILANDAIIVFTHEDDYFFGILHSKPHELWSLRLGTSLEDRPRYTPTTSFETFPFPWSPGKEPVDDQRVQAIAQAAKELVEKRDAWLNPPGASEAELKKRTLTNLYNQRPTWLALAHKKLDEAVLDAYGWPHDLSDEEILERLLDLNLERSKSQK